MGRFAVDPETHKTNVSAQCHTSPPASSSKDSHIAKVSVTLALCLPDDALTANELNSPLQFERVSSWFNAQPAPRRSGHASEMHSDATG
eukprot:CAMPEP_0181342278 /NCGR_PEP_ID=MMETSP1101-20121128/30907_1 /TAXON_ID=46948 /ORGANISM="Rhodomonas abbreviata, Strain Caron Lab Isolate" /LENGTH=88 /DNA_ID=CAMNT_0023453709 /DNA_START=140 /DNA_END=406 /DNA_ORIENTATION=+